MSTNSRKKRTKSVVWLFSILICVPIWLTYRELRTAALNRDLITAIIEKDYSEGLDLIHQGADGSARKNDTQNTGLLRALDELLKHLDSKPQASEVGNYNPFALMLLYDVTEQTAPIEANGSYYSAPVGFNRLVDALVDAHSPLVGESDRGLSLLDSAVIFHHHKIVKRLLERMRGPIRDQWYLLGTADLTDLALLLAHSAEVNETGPAGETALMMAASPQTEVLMSHGANINAVDASGRTPLLCALRFRGRQVDATAMALIEHGARVDIRDKGGSSPFLLACASASLKTVMEVYKRGGSLNDRDNNKITPLMKSLRNSDDRVVPWLLTHGAKVNDRDKGGRTALAFARQLSAQGGPFHQSFDREIQLLLQHGAK